MSLLAPSVFACSLLGLVVLFGLKAWERRHETVLAPSLRRRADVRALELKDQLMRTRRSASQIVPFLILLSRYVVHEGALAFARLAHLAALQANRLADLVSHKHHFERQAPRSEFLKAVAERPTVYEHPPTPVSPVTSEHPSIQTTTPTQAAPRPRTATRTHRKKKRG